MTKVLGTVDIILERLMKDAPIINWPHSVLMTLAIMPNLEVPVVTKIWVGGTVAIDKRGRVHSRRKFYGFIKTRDICKNFWAKEKMITVHTL